MITTLSSLYDNIRAHGKPEVEPTLEVYLRSFHALLQLNTEKPSYDLFFEIARDAFHTAPSPLNDSWMEITEPPKIEEDSENSKAIALETLIFLISDLRRMDHEGLLKRDPVILCGGITSPSGHSWYNLEPHLFLECAARGAVDIAGSEADVQLDEISWSEFASILDLGRVYE